MFGPFRQSSSQRGWTELDKLRRRYAHLERKILTGDYNESEVREFSMIQDRMIHREREAEEKWVKSFKS